jgi:vitamin B12 transporter
VRKFLFLLSCALVPVPVAAQDACEPDDSCAPIDDLPTWQPSEAMITVTATGSRIEVEDTGQSVSVIDLAEIVEVQGADVARVLRRLPGVSISSNGGLGSFTGLRVRGAEAEQTLVLIDGIRVSDPAAPAGGFDLGNLTTGNIEKIELLRGSNSTVWGSDAVGGVLAITTRGRSDIADEAASVKGKEQRAGGFANAEYGSRGTAFVSAAGGVSGEQGALGASASFVRTDGFSAATVGTEADGFEQWSVSGQGRVYLSHAIEAFARVNYAEGELEIDGFPFPSFTLADTEEFQLTRQLSAAAGLLYDSGPLFVQASYAFADTARDNFDPAFGTAPGFTSDGRSDRIEAHGEWRPIGPLLVNFGADREWTEYRTLFDAGAKARSFGAYTQLGIEFGGLSGHVGGRIDDTSRFGSATSFGADVSYQIGDLRLKASVGEGFKAPSLFQLFSDFGNTALAPEKSTGFDIGLSFRSRAWVDYAGITLFRRDSENLIDFVSCFGVTGGICTNRPFGTYDNVGRTRAQGLEVEAGKSFGQSLRLRASYSFTDTSNRTPGSPNLGNALARRPEHAFTFSGDWQIEQTAFSPAVGADVRYSSGAFDNAANTVRLDDYLVVDLRLVVPLLEIGGTSQGTLDLFGRVENLFDERYQTAAGYGQAGRGVFAGVRVGF